MPSRFRGLRSLRPYAVALATSIALGGLTAAGVRATIGVPATATLLSADTNTVDGTGAWTLLSTMSVVSSAGTLKAGYVTFTVRDPALFELRIVDLDSLVTLVGPDCGTLEIPGWVSRADMVGIGLQGASTNSCSLAISGLQVRPTGAGAAPLETSAMRVRCDTCGLATERTAATLTVVPGEAAVMQFTQGILDSPAGAAFPRQPVIHVADQYSNPRVGDTFQLNQLTAPGVVSAVKCAAQPVLTNASGDASFAGCTIDTPGTGYRLSGVRLLPIGSGLSAESNAFNVFGLPVKLGFKVHPGPGVTDQPFPTQPVVAVQDALGTTVSSGQGSGAWPVSLFLGPGAPVGASLSCAGGNTKLSVAGLATFSGCSITAAATYSLGATATTSLLPASSLAFVVAAPGAITLSTSAPIPPGAKNPVIQWGEGFTLGVQFEINGAARSVELQGSRDGLSWTQIATLTTDAAGHAAHPYRPVTNLYYRAVFAGAADLAAATSNQVRTTVRQLAVLRPTNRATTKSIARNTAITFSTTVRPSRPELAPASVTFIFSRQVTSTRLEVTKRTVVVDAAGVARTTFTFATAGRWYVRSQANPTAYNANSLLTPLETYIVR